MESLEQQDWGFGSQSTAIEMLSPASVLFSATQDPIKAEVLRCNSSSSGRGSFFGICCNDDTELETGQVGHVLSLRLVPVWMEKGRR